MTRRMLTALVALLGVFVAAYLALYKLGVIGTLACGTGGCEVVQTSRWATFLGLPVAAWGAVYYVTIFAIAFAGVQDRWAESRGLASALRALAPGGLLFSGWRTYFELVRTNAICRSCIVSAVRGAGWVVLALMYR